LGDDDPRLPRAWLPRLSQEEQSPRRLISLRSSRLSNAVLLGLANPPMRFQGWPLPTQPSEKDSPAGVRRSDVRLGSVEHL